MFENQEKPDHKETMWERKISNPFFEFIPRPLSIGYITLILIPILFGYFILGDDVNIYWWIAYTITIGLIPLFVLMHLVFPKQERADRLIKLHNELTSLVGKDNEKLTLKEVNSIYDQVKQVHDSRSSIYYVFPLILLTVIEAIGFFVIFTHYTPLIPNLIIDEFVFSVPNSILFGFFGGWIYSLYSILSRYRTSDISTGLIFSLTFQIFFSGISAYFILQLLEVSPSTSSALAFAIGFIPYSDSTEWIQNKANSMLVTGKQEFFSNERRVALERDNLIYVPGLSKLDIRRLNEEGVFTVQQLAFANPLSLYYVTTYDLFSIVMWVNEAYLRTYVTDDIALKLASIGIRGATSLNVSEIVQNKNNDDLLKINPDSFSIEMAKLMGQPVELTKFLFKKAEHDRKIIFLKALIEISTEKDTEEDNESSEK